jgi:hypothetical protein
MALTPTSSQSLSSRQNLKNRQYPNREILLPIDIG